MRRIGFSETALGGAAMRSLGAIVIGGYVNGLALVRALAAHSVPTVVITTTPHDIAHRSRYVSAHVTAIGVDERPELLVELLERRASEWSGWALFPTGDGALAALARHHDRLSSKYRVIAPPWEAARYLLDKGLMVEAARAVGMDVPHCYGPAVEATAALPDLRFPVIVKPVAGHRFALRFGCKLFVAHSREELRRCLSRIEGTNTPCSVFDFVPGPDSQIYAYCTYVDGRGEPSAGVTVRKLRQGPPLFGVARVAEVALENPTLRAATVEMLRRIGFRGMASAEFKLDPRDGAFRFIEVNGRSVIYNGLLRQAGLDLGRLAWSDYVDGRAEPARPNGWPGVWINLHADVLYSMLCRQYDRVGFAEFLRPYSRPKIDAVWSAWDPLPFVAQWSRTAREGASALWRSRYRKLLAERALPLSGV
jgi:predicted ATP-grasp superfamily ATP-dependent carboligase